MADPRDDPVGVRAARMVLLEVWTVLAEHRDALTLVGGSAPVLLFDDDVADPYVGSLDVDAVVDPAEVPEDAYRTIAEQLRGRGYRQDENNAFRWYREVSVDERAVEVELDLLAPASSGGRQRHERIEGEPLARRTKGAELVRGGYVIRSVEGTLPDGRQKRIQVRVASPAVLIVLKALAVAGRDKLKDAYDIDYVLGHVDIGAIAKDLRAVREIPPVAEAIDGLRSTFSSTEADGPVAVEAYRRLAPGSTAGNEVRALAYARVQLLIDTVFRSEGDL